MELRRLRYFCAVAEELHFGRAAARVHMAQPALSQQIRVLEAELSVRLLDRTSRRVSLTEAGRILYPDAIKLLAAADRAEARVRAVASGGAGILRVHTTRSAPSGVTASVIDRFRDERPEVELQLVTGFTGWNLEELYAGRSDVVVVRPPVDAEPGVELVGLGLEELVVALPSGHHLSVRRRLRVGDLAGEGVVSWPRRNAPGLHARIEAEIWADEPPRVVREEPDDEQIMRAVAAGAGIAVMIGSRVEELRVRGVVFRRFVAPPPTVGLALAWRPEAAPSVAARFVEVALAMSEGLRG